MLTTMERQLRALLANGSGYMIFEWNQPSYGYTQFGLSKNRGLFWDVPLCPLSEHQVLLAKSLLDPFGIPAKEVNNVGPVYQIPVRGARDGARLAWEYLSVVHGVSRAERLTTVLGDWD